eukprot:Awhi_evm1s15352
MSTKTVSTCTETCEFCDNPALFRLDSPLTTGQFICDRCEDDFTWSQSISFCSMKCFKNNCYFQLGFGFDNDPVLNVDIPCNCCNHNNYDVVLSDCSLYDIEKNCFVKIEKPENKEITTLKLKIDALGDGDSITKERLNQYQRQQIHEY